MLTVKQVAKKLNLTEYAVRYYTNQGLIPTVKRNHNNVRLFNDNAVEWLYGCKMLRSTGISIQGIKKYVDLCLAGQDTVKERYNLMIKQQKFADNKLKEAQKNLSFIKKKVSIYEDAIKNNKNVDPLNPNNKY